MRQHICIALILFAPAMVHAREPAIGDACGLLTERQWFELGLSDARKSNVPAALDEDVRQAQSEPPAKEHRLLTMPQGLCLALSIDMLQAATAWCAGARHGGVLIVSTPERYDPSGAYLPMKAKALFETVERKLAQDAAATRP